MKRTVMLVFALGMLISTLPLSAHHAFTAEFDAKKPVKLRGAVAKVELINPHSWIHIDVKNSDGTTTRWMIEGGTPNTLLRRGFTKNSLPAGTEILVDGYQAKDAAKLESGAPRSGAGKLARGTRFLRTPGIGTGVEMHPEGVQGHPHTNRVSGSLAPFQGARFVEFHNSE